MRLVLALAICPGLALAQGWERLDDDAIRSALGDRVLVYDAYTQQYFGKAGDTRYITDRAADGRWDVRGGQYCSQWPPSDTWACYDVERDGNRVRFIGSDRSVSEGVFAE